MNAHVIRIQGSAWRPRKGGSVKLVIEVRPGTQAEWVEALEMFAQKPELSVTVVAPKVPDSFIRSEVLRLPNDGEAMKETVAALKGEITSHTYAPAGYGPVTPVVTTGPSPVVGEVTHGGITHPVALYSPPTVTTKTDNPITYLQGYDAFGIPKSDVDCPESMCQLDLGHPGPHDSALGGPFETPAIPDCPKPNCNLLAGHKGKCVKKKVKA